MRVSESFRMNKPLLALLFTLSASCASAQMNPPPPPPVVPPLNVPAVDDLLERLRLMGLEADKLKSPPPAETPAPLVIKVPQTANLQTVINGAAPYTTIELCKGCTFAISWILPKPIHDITITTEGWVDLNRGVGALGAAKPALDAANMATIKGGFGTAYGLWVMGSNITIKGVKFGPNYNGQGEMLRIGDNNSTVLGDTPKNILVKQNLFIGDPGNVFGQKRGINANGINVLISQNYFDYIWMNGQDSQGVAVLSTPGPVTIKDNIIIAASENVLIGGVPPAGPDFLPADVLTQGNYLGKRAEWIGASPARVVKNLYEVKIGKRIMARGNWMQLHWNQAQPGPAVVLSMAVNGTTCAAWCVMEDIGFEDNVVWDVSAGVNILGIQYGFPPGSGQGQRFSIKNNLFWMNRAVRGGNGRPLITSGQPKTILWDHNTSVHDGTAFLAGDYGTIWPYQEPNLTHTIPAGPVQGMVWTNSIQQHGTYGLFTPEGSSGINPVTMYPGLVFGSNIIGGVTASALTKYNLYQTGTGANTGPSLTDFQALFVDYANKDFCLKVPGPGADCTKLPFAIRGVFP